MFIKYMKRISKLNTKATQAITNAAINTEIRSKLLSLLNDEFWSLTKFNILLVRLLPPIFSLLRSNDKHTIEAIKKSYTKIKFF